MGTHIIELPDDTGQIHKGKVVAPDGYDDKLCTNCKTVTLKKIPVVYRGNPICDVCFSLLWDEVVKSTTVSK